LAAEKTIVKKQLICWEFAPSGLSRPGDVHERWAHQQSSRLGLYRAAR